MPNVYRAGFDITGPVAPGQELYDLVEVYLRQWAAATFSLPEDYVDGADHQVGGGDDSLRMEGARGEDEACFHLKAFRAGCNLNFWLTSRGAGVQATLELRLSEDDHRQAAAPRFLGGLVKEFSCEVEGEELSAGVLNLTAESAESFADDLVFNQDRKLPLVLIAGERSIARAVLEPERLVGIARLVICPDAAIDAMNGGLGSLRCYGGTARIYFPGCGPTDQNWTHPFWPNTRLRQLGSGFYSELRDNLMAYLAMRPSGDLFTDVVASIRSYQHQAALALSQEAAENKVLEVLADTENELRAEIEHYKEENVELRRTIFSLHQRVNSLEGRFDAEEEIDEEWATELQQFRSVEDVLERAVGSLKSLRILESAFKSARNFHYTNRDQIWDVFVSMDKCAGILRERHGSLGRSLEQWFSDEGHDFASSESQATMDMHGETRAFQDPVAGHKIEMQSHFKLGGNQLRIHVRWMQEEGRWLIGHVGQHLPTSSY